MAAKLRKVWLPSGLVVTLEPRGVPSARKRRPRMPLFSEVADVVAKQGAETKQGADVALFANGAPLDLGVLSLTDFHALRALLTHDGWLFEAPVRFACRNCEAELTTKPCAAMPTGPFVNGELGDPELDGTLPFGESHPIATITLPGGVEATTVRFAPRTVAEAAPLHRALRRRAFRLSARVVRAMGLDALGAETDPSRIARALESASDEAFQSVADAFLASHYPPRLFALVPCPRCGARNDVDAPYERELDVGAASRSGDAFPSFEVFAAYAEEAFTRYAPEGEGVSFVVEGGVPACDDGGEPLLGSYVPVFEGSATAPSRAPEVTVYYRTFKSVWDDDGPYDWRAEVDETIEHELEHHEGALVGHDPMDEEERALLRDEAKRVHGTRALAEQAVSDLGADFVAFLRHTWPVWLLIAIVTLLLLGKSA